MIKDITSQEKILIVLVAGQEHIIEYSQMIKLIESLELDIEFVSSKVYNVTKLGSKLSQPLSARKVNQLLQQKGYQVKAGKKWEATDKGKKFAVCKPRVFTIKDNNTYSISYDLFWREDIIDELEITLKEQEGEVA